MTILSLTAWTPPLLFLSTPALGLIVLVVLILFGPGKLPHVMKSLGDGVRQFKNAASTTDAPSIPESHNTPES